MPGTPRELAGWLLGCLAAWLVGWLAGWLAGRTREAGGGPQELNEYDRGKREEGAMAGRTWEAGGGPQELNELLYLLLKHKNCLLIIM